MYKVEKCIAVSTQFIFPEEKESIGIVLEKRGSMLSSFLGSWRLTDLGKALQHANDPNCVVEPIGSTNQCLFANRTLFVGDILTVDFHKYKWFTPEDDPSVRKNL